MSEDKPEGFQISAVRKVICCECVPEQVRVKPFYAGDFLQTLKNKLYRIFITPSSVLIQEERLGTAGELTKFQPIVQKLFAGLVAYGDKPLLAAFTAYDHGLSAKGDIAYIDPGDFSAAKSAVKHKQHEAFIAKAVMRE